MGAIYIHIYIYISFPDGSMGKKSTCKATDTADMVLSLCCAPLEEGMTTHSSILAWRIPWIEEPGRLQSKALQRAGHY